MAELRNAVSAADGVLFATPGYNHGVPGVLKKGDPTTADLFSQVSRALDKDLWFLEAHLQSR